MSKNIFKLNIYFLIQCLSIHIPYIMCYSSYSMNSRATFYTFQIKIIYIGINKTIPESLFKNIYTSLWISLICLWSYRD